MKTSFLTLDTPESLQIVRDIAAEVWPKTFAPILPPEQIPYMMKMMYAPEVMEREQREGYHFAALVVDGTPSGYISWSPYHGETAKLHKVYLLTSCQGKGFGRMMLDYASEVCRAAGFDTLRLNVNKHNERAIAVYLKNGFRTVESVKNDIGGGFFMDDYVMEKRLG
jgi:ribosomal protein S18 acetylase RimI-like enzyme